MRNVLIFDHKGGAIYVSLLYQKKKRKESKLKLYGHIKSWQRSFFGEQYQRKEQEIDGVDF